MLTIEILENMFETQLEETYETKQMEEDHRELAGMIVRIADVFPEWELKVADMRRKLEIAKTIARERGRYTGLGFYGVYRPIEGVPFCLVPN